MVSHYGQFMGKITVHSASLNQGKACLNQSNSAQKNRNEVRYLSGELNLENYLKRHWLQDLQEKPTRTLM